MVIDELLLLIGTESFDKLWNRTESKLDGISSYGKWLNNNISILFFVILICPQSRVQ